MNAKHNHQNMKGKLQEAAAEKRESVAAEKKTVKEAEEAAAEAVVDVAKVAEEAAHWKDVAMRTAAEMENLRKRTQIDMEKAVRYANGSFAKDLLSVADCMEQAMACAHTELDKEKAAGKEIDPVVENLLKGVEMTHQNLMSALKKQQIEKIESLGKEAGTIVQELQPGYTIGGDRVLRDAMVVVSRK